MSNFVLYLRNEESVRNRIRHTIRLKLNSRAICIKDILANVPDSATVQLITGNGWDEGYGEIVFLEEKESEGK